MRKLFFISCVLSLSLFAEAKTITLTKNYYADASQLGCLPGDTLLMNTSRASLYLANVHGDAGKLIVIMPAPGASIFGVDSRSFKLEVSGSSFFKVVGFDVRGNGPGTGAGGCKFYYDTDFDVTDMYIHNVDRAGLILKNDPNPADPKTYYPVIIKNVRLINIVVDTCQNEGFYIGSTKDSLNGKKNSPIVGIQIKNCAAKHTGWDGVQVTNSTNIDLNGLLAIDNGTLRQQYQQSNVTIQDATTGSFRNIKIDGGTATGLFIFSRGIVTLDNVRISNVQNGIFIDNRSDWGYNLPAQQLIASNIYIVGSGPGYPLYYGNTNPKPIPGTVTNFVYDKSLWGKPLSDPYNKYVILPIKTLLFQFIDELNKKTYKIFSDSTWTTQ